jgi:hypothetical protein
MWPDGVDENLKRSVASHRENTGPSGLCSVTRTLAQVLRAGSNLEIRAPTIFLRESLQRWQGFSGSSSAGDRIYQHQVRPFTRMNCRDQVGLC